MGWTYNNSTKHNRVVRMVGRASNETAIVQIYKPDRRINIMNNKVIKIIQLQSTVIEQQELILTLRNKLARLRGKYGDLLEEVEL